MKFTHEYNVFLSLLLSIYIIVCICELFTIYIVEINVFSLIMRMHIPTLFYVVKKFVEEILKTSIQIQEVRAPW